MKKNFENSIRLEGYVYQHSLEEKTVKNTASANFGKPFIGGSLFVATDDEGLNVVEVHYSYVTPTTKKGSVNPTYKALKQIIDGKTWITDGKDEALKVIVSPSIALNDFYDREGNLVSPKRAEGGFVSIASSANPINPDPDKRCKFLVDMVVTSLKDVEPNEEKGYEGYTEVRGCIFDFRNAVLPVGFNMKDQRGIDWLHSLEPSPANPVLIKGWGKIISETTTVEIKEEGAFGEAFVRTVPRNHKEWLMTSAKDTEIFGEENTITAEELKKAMQDREVYLAGVKKRAEEYQASKAAGTAPVAAPVAASADGFNF